MTKETMTWAPERGFAIEAAVSERMGFIRRTYAHLLMELCGVALVTSIGMKVEAIQNLAITIANPLVYILAIFGLAFGTRKMLAGTASKALQYTAAGLWVFFLGLLVTLIATIVELRGFALADILGRAFVITACAFTGLTAYVFFSRKDFSFMGGALSMATWALFGFGIVAVFFGFQGSALYSILWIVLLGGWVLYDTGRILHHRRVDEHVAASVDLLVDFVYMFIHIAMLLMRARD